MSLGSPDGLCQENSGFLFRMRCDRFAQGTCGRCGKAVCHEHGHMMVDGLACTSCVKLSAAKRPSETDKHAAENGGDDPMRRPSTPDASRDSPYDDPYFQGERWYGGFGGYRFGGLRSRSSPETNRSTAADQPAGMGGPVGNAGNGMDGGMANGSEGDIKDDIEGDLERGIEGNAAGGASDDPDTGTSPLSDHDAADFTEGDAASFMDEADESYEFDMGES